MQRRIVFIVNAIFKCLPNLALLVSFPLVQLCNEAAYLFIRQSTNGLKKLGTSVKSFPVYLALVLGVCRKSTIGGEACGSLARLHKEMLSVKDTQ